MDCYIELQFGQMTDTQREIIPTSSIETVYVELPEAKNIVFVLRNGDRTFHRREYYQDNVQCNRRWNKIRKILGVENQIIPGFGVALPMDASEWELFTPEQKAEYRERNKRLLRYPEDDES